MATRIAAQRAAVAELERRLWEGGYDAAWLAPYQAAFRDLEALLAAGGEDRRHRFVILIPVADSPVHLRACLDSLVELCRAYGYGGQTRGHYRKVAVLLADDSREPANIARHRAMAAALPDDGIACEYFGAEQQLALLDRLGAADLTAILGDHDRAAFSHKGQAMTRNLAYLRLAELHARSGEERLLFYTIDADQEFRVKVATDQGAPDVCAVNFLFHLDEIFTATPAQVLTGKVVGDPPVSPAVMAGNFLEDVLGFLAEMAAADPGAPYRQPVGTERGSGDAAYHDMAELFGFRQATTAYRYRCALPDRPGNDACFAEFARHLNSFFHGEHPTRVTYYAHQAPLASVQPARTVYTGNYVFRPEALGWFIPFAPLRLRMSGPTLGRIMKAELGGRFVSANLPMLHSRTLEATGSCEFRPGVAATRQAVDLGDEFERQFHGDVLLFAMERLAALGYPGRPVQETVVSALLEAVQADMATRYHAKQQATVQRLAALEGLLQDPQRWWQRRAHLSRELATALDEFRAFAANIQGNFGATAPGFRRIDDAGRRATWRARQLAAIQGLPAHRHAWTAALARLCGLPGDA